MLGHAATEIVNRPDVDADQKARCRAQGSKFLGRIRSVDDVGGNENYFERAQEFRDLLSS
jgi:hypothetical protein